MKTKEKLAEVLRTEGLTDMAELAATGYYDDYESPFADNINHLVQDLRGHGRNDLAKRAIEGEWDGTKEEGDAWFEKEGKHLLKGH